LAKNLFFPLGALALVAGMVFSVWAHAGMVEAEGAATIDAGGVDKARQLAIKDALRKAEESAGMEVSSSTVRTTDGNLRENSRFRPLGVAANPTVLNEWREAGTLFVRIRADVTLSEKPQSYRKKIAITQFYVADPLQVQDIDNIWNGYPLALLRRIGDSGLFLPVQTSGWPALGQLPLPLDRAQNRETVRLLADQSGAQFVLSGIIYDAGTDPSSGVMPKFVPSILVPKSLRNVPGSRRIEAEIFLHDGITGALIANFRAQESAPLDPAVSRDKPFGSAAFFATGFGGAVARLLDRQAQFIVKELGHMPFNAKVIRTEGNRLFFDAGATSGMIAGDKFLIYTLSSVTDAMEPSSNRLLGIAEKPAASLTVKQVQPLFSVGESDAKNLKIQIGDMIRFEPPGIPRNK
jgi:hypothetical protein